MNLVRLTEKTAKLYDEFLVAIGHEPVNLKKISVDRRGFSPEVARVYGKDYMKGHVAIATIAQNDAGIAYKKYSAFLDNLLDQVFEKGDVIKAFDNQEVLFGKLVITPDYASPFLDFEKGKGYEAFEEESPIERMLSENQYRISISFETPSGMMTEMRNVVENVDKLDEEPSLLEDEEYLQGIVEIVNKIKSKGYTDLRSMRLDPSIDADSFSIRTDDYEVYAIKNKASCYLVYFGEDCPKHSSIIHGDDVGSLLTKLLEEKFLSIDNELIKKKIEDLEMKLLRKKGFNIKKMNPWDIYNQLTQLKKEIPLDYIKLWATIKEGGKFKDLDLKLKKEVVKPNGEDVNELWERVVNGK